MKFWKHKKEEPSPVPKEKSQPVFNPEKEVAPVSTSPQERKSESLPQEPQRRIVAHLGKTLVVKGELSGGEDLYIEGQLEGTIELREHSLTIGPKAACRLMSTRRMWFSTATSRATCAQRTAWKSANQVQWLETW